MQSQDTLFGQIEVAPRRQSGRKWIAVLAIALLLWVFWHYGIISAIWKMLCDLSDACEDFLQYVLRLRT